MKREIITIDKYGRLDIPTDTAAIWMTEAEIVELFGTTAGAVHTGVKAIFKGNVLHVRIVAVVQTDTLADIVVV